MFTPTLRGWTAASSLGFCLAFLSFLPGPQLMELFTPEALAGIDMAMLPEHVDPDALPEWLDRSAYETMYRTLVIYHLFGLALFGLILGSFQASALRSVLPGGFWPWALATSAAFAAILALEAVEPHLVTGPYAGPVEPIVIAFGGGSLAGLLQWLYLRRRGIEASRWPLLWIAGLAVGIAAAAAILTLLGSVLEAAVRSLFPEEAVPLIGWGIMLVVYGAVVGAVAGLFSGSSLLAGLRRASLRGEVA